MREIVTWKVMIKLHYQQHDIIYFPSSLSLKHHSSIDQIKNIGASIKNSFLTFGAGGGGGGGYTVGADILSSADWYHHSIICVVHTNKKLMPVYTYCKEQRCKNKNEN